MPCDRQQGQARQGANMSRKRVANKPKTTVRHETMRGQSHSLFCSLLCSPAPRPCRTSLPELFSRLFSSVRCQPLHISCCSPFNKHLWSRSIDISPSPSRRGLFSFPRSTQLQIIPPAFQHVAFDTRAAHQVLPPTTHIAPDCKPLDPFRLWYHEPTSPGSFRSLASHTHSLHDSKDHHRRLQHGPRSIRHDRHTQTEAATDEETIALSIPPWNALSTEHPRCCDV